MISKIQFPDGTVITSGDTENAILSATVTQCVNSAQELTLGSVCCQMLEAELIMQQPFSLDAGTAITFSRDGLIRGTFFIQKPAYPSGNRLKFTAFDPICRLDTDVTQWFASLAHWPYRLYDLAWMVCAQCGLELSNTEIPNGTLEISSFTASGITGRQLLSMIAEAAGCFCRATKAGKVEFAWYENAPVCAGVTDADIPFPKSGNLSIATDLPGQLELSPVTQVPAGTGSVVLRHYAINLASVYGYSTQPMASPSAQRYVNNSVGTSINYASANNTIRFTQSSVAQKKNPMHSSNGYFFIGVNQPFVQDQTVTISFDLQLTDNPLYLDKLYLYLNGTDTGGYFSVGNGRSALTLPWQVNGARSYLEIRLGGCSGSITNLQIQYGDRVSPYSPYPMISYTASLPNTLGGTLDWRTGDFVDTDQVLHKGTPASFLSRKGSNAFWSNVGQTTVSYRQVGCFQGGLQYAGFATAPIDSVIIRQNGQDVGVQYPETGENPYILEGNPLLASTDAMTVAQVLYDKIKNISYTPCTLKIPAEQALQAGQIVQVNTPDGGFFLTYVMKQVQNAHTQTLTATGEARRDSPLAQANARYGDLPGKLLQIDRSIDGLKIENRQGQQQLASLSLTVDGIGTQVQQQSHTMAQQLQTLTQFQQTADALTLSVQSLQENGAQKVSTRTGYRFDDTGLHITGSGSDLQNAITEKGMYVLRDENTVVLKADAQGVLARDVSVGNYLIIGQFARLEDYADGRTACYFTGG